MAQPYKPNEVVEEKNSCYGNKYHDNGYVGDIHGGCGSDGSGRS